MASPTVVDIEHAFVGRKGESFGREKIVGQEHDAARSPRRDSAGTADLPRQPGGAATGSVKRCCVGFDDDIVRPAEALP